MKRSGWFLTSATSLLGAAFIFAVSAFAANPNAPVRIADSPVFVDVKSHIPQNALLLADDSGSMTWAHALEGLGDIPRACWRGGDGVIGGVMVCLPSDPHCSVMDVCGYPYPNPYPDQGTGYPNLGVSKAETAVKLLPPPLMAAGFNKMAYNTEVTYLPPVYEDRNGQMHSFPSMNSANTTNWTKVGWPGCDGSMGMPSDIGMSCPQGVPVAINMRDVTTNFPTARTYSGSLIQIDI
ncbi:MAG: hypothetical protein LBE75_04205 [Burkholderiales bacterium]|jgi:hypothetical protein|nr:hypothetical protein [Burkholderiales bacterium]